MPDIPEGSTNTAASFISSLKDDVWHGRAVQHSFERWHFDALSDDGREALVISFYDNYPFSPRYFSRRNVVSADVNSGQFPAVTFLYAQDGEAEVQAVNEWSFDAFSARMDDVSCSIGDSNFRVEKAGYGSGYIVHCEVVTARNRRIEADLEWLSIESDLITPVSSAVEHSLIWNLVAPRSDVSGRIVRTGPRGKLEKTTHFRGTGYHDHFRSSVSLTDSITSRCWGRAHFADVTAVFENISYEGSKPDASQVALVRNGSIDAREAKFSMTGRRFDEEGASAEFTTNDGCSVKVESLAPLHRDHFEQRMLADITLSPANGESSRTRGFVEHCDPKGMTNPLHRWMSDLRIGRNGGSPYL